MNVGLFGGTFDPIHRGHLAVARAARRRFRLDRIYFVPAHVPPHKQKRKLAPYRHRYAMVALATAGQAAFVPSRLEEAAAPARSREARPSYSIETVRRLKRQLARRDQLYFLIGADAFGDLATWRQPQALCREVEFIVAARPGFSLARAAAARPGARLHRLSVRSPVSATQVRAAARRGKTLARLVPPAVAAYIGKHGLYRTASA